MNTEEQISVKFELFFFNIFIEENAFENVVCEKSTILSRPRCVKLDGDEALIIELDELHLGSNVHRRVIHTCLAVERYILIPQQQNQCSMSLHWLSYNIISQHVCFL